MAGTLGLGLLSAAAVPAAAAGLDPEVMARLPVGQPYKDPKSGATFTFLQKNAGASSASTWRTARSLGCGYAVGMPGPYNELKAAGPTTDGGSMSTISLATRTLEGCRFTVSCTRRSDGKVAANAVSGVLAGLAGAGTEMARSVATVQGHAATRLRLRGKGGSLFGIQILRLDDRIYQQMIECSGMEEKGFSAIEGHFFESLDLRPPGGTK